MESQNYIALLLYFQILQNPRCASFWLNRRLLNQSEFLQVKHKVIINQHEINMVFALFDLKNNRNFELFWILSWDNISVNSFISLHNVSLLLALEDPPFSARLEKKKNLD